LGKATPVEISDRIFDRGDRASAGLTIASRDARDDQEAQNAAFNPWIDLLPSKTP
jgi:hypothetical protein